MAETRSQEHVVLGRVSGIYGVRGWVRVFSFTEPRAGILDYPTWLLGSPPRRAAYRVEDGRMQGKGIIARLEGVDDRDKARALQDAEIAVPRDALSPLPPGEYYWIDLMGLEVVTADGTMLGTVAGLMETGANDVLVVKGERERLIPYLPDQVVLGVDRPGGRITVDWDPEL